jgi:hypothetical protein
MDYATLKCIISAGTWMILWYGFLSKPVIKLAKSWHVAHFILFVLIISFSWGYFVGEMVDVVHHWIK